MCPITLSFPPRRAIVLALCLFNLVSRSADIPASSGTSKPTPQPQSLPDPTATAARTNAVPREPAFEFEDGDRVVFLGDTFVEREGSHGYMETRITSEFPGKRITFRNLGWSGDTPAGQARVSFDWSKPESEWFRQLKESIAAVKPTVVILGYGMANSFDGEAGLPKFKSDINRLMDTIQETATGTPIRFVLIGPIRHEKLGAPLPDPTPHNAQLALYTQALREIAADRKSRFVPLFEMMPDGTTTSPARPLTDNGIHLNAYGYWRVAETIGKGLGWQPNVWQISIIKAGELRRGSFGIEVTNIVKRTNYVSFEGTPQNLDVPPLPVPAPAHRITQNIYVQFVDLKDTNYTLKIDGQPVATRSAREWKNGNAITNAPSLQKADELRKTIVKKNELFFYRWRPENHTYLFGFRKQEQGQNSREIPEFDPLVAGLEQKIATLKLPTKHRFELIEAEAAAPAAGAGKPAAAESAATPTTRSALPSPATAQPTAEFEVQPGFEINLYAESPQLAKPIQMNFDPQGRLWVASSEVYPQIKPGQVANDKILVLEDTDGDGRAETSTVFADGLLIPTGVEPGDGGVYVGASTELLFLKDTDGDGKADQRRVVLSGFGTEDTHHILHTLRWGHDGQLYFNQSIYIHSHLETPHGVRRLNSGGVWHLRPDTMELGVFLKGFCNPWGHHFDAFGQSFVTDGAGFQGVSWGIEGATYFTYADMRREMKSISPGNYPKFCGIEVLESRQFPDDWQGDIITADFRAHRIVRFKPSELGAGYATKEMPDLLRTTNVTFRPIDVKLGPDGALYIADWSNPIIQHGEVDFRDSRRDHEHGRIWRVTAKGRPLNPRRDFTKLPNMELLDALLTPNNYDRQRARRVLTERGISKVRSDLGAWTSSHTDEKASLEALWMHQALDRVDTTLLNRVLAAKDERIRAAGARVLWYWQKRIAGSGEDLAKLAQDEHPRVRVEAVRALGQNASAASAAAVLGVLDKPMDEFLDYAAWLSINDLATPWIEAVQSGTWKIEGRERQLEFALQSIQPKLAAPVLAKLLESRPIPRDGSGPWIALIGRAGSEKELGQLLDAAAGQKLDDSATARAFTALAKAARDRKIRPASNTGAIAPFLKSPNAALREQAARLAGAWKLDSLVPGLLNLAGDPGASNIRQAAFDSLREIGGTGVFESIQSMTAGETPAPVRRQAVQTLAMLNLSKAMPSALKVLADSTSETDAVELWRTLLSTKGAAKTVTQALPKSGFATVAAKAGMKVARENGRNEPELILALARSGGLEDDSRNLTAAEIQQMIASVRQTGDAARGEQVYRRSELACATCHSIGGVGGKVGPDLTSIGASAPVDYLIESLLYPNRNIKEGYHSFVIETKDGEEVSGVVVQENTEQITVRDATNREVTVQKNNIQRKTQGGSLMPSGLSDGLSASDQLDLYRFLSELGKPGPYDASKGNVARFWRVRPFLHTDEQSGEGPLITGDLNAPQWKPLSSFVDGRLTREMMSENIQVNKYTGVTGVFTATRIQVPKNGQVRLKLPGVKPMATWIDGQPVTGDGMLSAELSAGTHTIIMKLDPKKLPEFVRLETEDGTFLTN